MPEGLKQKEKNKTIKIEKYKFKPEKEERKIQNLDELPEEYVKVLPHVGFDPKESQRSGSFFQLNCSTLFAKAKQAGLEIMSTVDALKKYNWLKNYWWKAVSVTADEYTMLTEEKGFDGYFIRALPGVKTIFPLQACLFIGEDKLAQNVHNIIIAEENSELHIITGCTIATYVKSALHVGVSEFFVGKNAKISFTMIHSWGKNVDVRPRTGIIVDENGVFISNYICLNPVKSLQMYPTAHCTGKNAKVTFQSILFASENSWMDVGSRTFLKEENSTTQMLTRAVAKDQGDITVRGHLIGEASNVKGHLECRGLILSDNARIHAIPELEAKAENVELTHEAAVGKIAEEEIMYLMARGLNFDEAVSVLVGGFLRLNLEELPDQLRNEIRRMLKLSMKKFI